MQLAVSLAIFAVSVVAFRLAMPVDGTFSPYLHLDVMYSPTRPCCSFLGLFRQAEINGAYSDIAVGQKRRDFSSSFAARVRLCCRRRRRLGIEPT